MAGKEPINENELDELLRQLYLEKDSSEINEANANFVLEQDYHTNIDPKKESELIARLQSKSKGFGGFKFYLFVLIVIGIIAFLVLYFYSERNKVISVDQNNKTGTLQTQNSVTPVGEYNTNSLNTNSAAIKVVDTFGRVKVINSFNSIDTSIAQVKENVNLKTEDDKRSIPFLTEKDKIKYRNVKEQIISKLIKLDKGLYTHIPAYKLNYAGKPIILDAFTIRNMGITNIEYKTFLADLLVQNRNEDYLKSEVFQENWTKYGYDNLAVTYYQGEKYNDFPAVNMSYEGAKLFCKWLEDEVILYIQHNNLKLKPLQIRLPYDEEWIFAAREGYAKIAFEKGYNTIYDETEGLVDKAFTNRVELVKKRVKRVDTLYNFYTTNRYGWNEKEITDFFGIGFKYYNLNPTDTIYIERMKVLGKIGRVSEMVPQKNTTRIWLPGLSWKSKEDYLKLESEFKSNLSSPFVGFRIVVINPNDPEYKNPFW